VSPPALPPATVDPRLPRWATVDFADDRGSALSGVWAVFARVQAGGAPPQFGADVTPAGCHGEKVGRCCFTAWTSDVPAPDAGASVGVDVGPLGFTRDGAPWFWIAFVDGGYAPARSFPVRASNLPSPDGGDVRWRIRWEAGQRLGLAVDGGPTGEVVAPPPLVLTSPAAPDPLAPLPHVQAEPLRLTWTPDPAGTLLVVLSARRDDGVDLLGCDAADAAGALEVPPALLSRFAAGAEVSVSLRRSHVAQAAGAFPLRATAAVSTGFHLQLR
jgi:hypothetical protein